MSLLDELPKSPEGEPLTAAYWSKIETDINMTGDKFLELYGEFKDDNILGYNGEARSFNLVEKLHRLGVKHGKMPYCVVLTIFGEPLQDILPFSVFDAVIKSEFETMPDEWRIAVERLRFINTKYVERKNNLISRLRGRNIAFKN